MAGKGETTGESVELLPEQDMKMLAQQMIMGPTYKRAKLQVTWAAKRHGVDKDVLLQQVRNHVKGIIRELEKGSLRHYHRTSMNSFRTIVEEGRMLSIPKLKERRPDVEPPKGSVCEDIMFTRDVYDGEGVLSRPGFEPEHKHGASGADVVLVFKDSMMDLDDYDATYSYPTISELPLDRYCEAVLVNNEQTKQEAERLLQEKGLNIPVKLQDQWSF
jgi:hypothetical protein